MSAYQDIQMWLHFSELAYRRIIGLDEIVRSQKSLTLENEAESAGSGAIDLNAAEVVFSDQFVIMNSLERARDLADELTSDAESRYQQQLNEFVSAYDTVRLKLAPVAKERQDEYERGQGSPASKRDRSIPQLMIRIEDPDFVSKREPDSLIFEVFGVEVDMTPVIKSANSLLTALIIEPPSL